MPPAPATQPSTAVARAPGRGKPTPGPVMRVSSRRQAITLYEEIIRADRVRESVTHDASGADL